MNNRRKFYCTTTKSNAAYKKMEIHCGLWTHLKQTSKKPRQNRCASPFPTNSLETATITYLVPLLFCFRIFLFILKDITYNNKRFLWTLLLINTEWKGTYEEKPGALGYKWEIYNRIDSNKIFAPAFSRALETTSKNVFQLFSERLCTFYEIFE